MTTKNLWDAAKAVLRGKFIAIQYQLKKQEKHQTDNLTLHLKKNFFSKEQKNPKISRRKEIIMIQAEINAKEMKKALVKINKSKSWFFEKIKMTSLQPDSSRKKEKRIKSPKLQMKKEKVTPDNVDI